MPGPRDYALLGLVLGTVLVSAAVFAAPSGFYPEYHYAVERVTMDDEAFVYGWATQAPEVLDCDAADPSLSCAFERRVRERGPVVRDAHVRDGYELVFFENRTNGGAYYRTTGTELENGSVAHGLERIGPRAALELASLDADPHSAAFQRLLDRGEIRTTTPLIDWEIWERSEYHVLEYEGRFYRQAGFAYLGSRHRVELLVRWLVGLVGFGLLSLSTDRLRRS